MEYFNKYIKSIDYPMRMGYFNKIAYMHFFNDMFVCLYPYILSPIYDFYFVLFGLLTSLHWIVLKNECIFSYIEKKLLNPNYELGADCYLNPYHKKFYYYNNVNYFFIKEFFWIVTFLLIIFYRKNPNYVKYMVVLLIIIVIILKGPQFLKK
jgi:hypothetical protein